ncbi:MAG: 2,4-dienoyl-CoA reductase [Acidobacteria bacterium]|nr:MAG: 2,4-dienoyl-CoA reductase [Acidobacteriota bacterium]
MLPDRALDGRVAIITGGGTGIGRAIATEYARLGARLVLASRSLEHLEPAAQALRSTFSTEVLAVPTDVRVPEQVERLSEEAARRLGSIDILVNNAAGNFICPAEKLSPNGWNAVVDIVLNGAFYCSRAVGLRMIESGRGGNILNIVATYAWTGGPGTIHSACAKAGVVCMTRTLAVEWAPHKIRVNAIAPGPVETEGAGSKLWATPEARRAMLGTVPRGRIGTPEEIARGSAYLVSDYADFVTGEVLVMDGGQWLGKGMFAEERARR